MSSSLRVATAQAPGSEPSATTGGDGDCGDSNGHANDYQAGDVVWTVYGAGVIVQVISSSSSSSTSNRDGNDDAAAATATATAGSDDGRTGKSVTDADDGTTSSTTTKPSFYHVRLWRIPGKSMGSSALAIFTPNTIVERLPVAPGMVTSIKHEQQQQPSASSDNDDQQQQYDNNVLVNGYDRSRNVYLVSRLATDEEEEGLQPSPRSSSKPSTPQQQEQNEASSSTTTPPSISRRRSSAAIVAATVSAATQQQHSNSNNGAPQQQPSSVLEEVAPEQLADAPSRKFYPILETLMKRADDAVHVAESLVHQHAGVATKLLDTTTNMVQQQINNNKVDMDADDVVNDVGDVVTKKIDAITDKVAAAAPQADANMKQVLCMMRDEEITTLLQNCQDRLRKLTRSEIETATLHALAETGIHFDDDEHDDDGEGGGGDGGGATQRIIATSRKNALDAVENLLSQADLEPADLDKAKEAIAQNFTTAFDSLQQAAQSDRTLNTLFENINEKTTLWQEQTGRLLQTRSANLFLEGASRLQQRAAALFGQYHGQLGGEIGSKLKAFTEGDAAIARLKTIELGDAIKNRLVDAIQVRSESMGGLDGIIAGALSTIKEKTSSASGAPGGGQIQNMLSHLQETASSMTTDAHETLISVLSSRSMYRDVALLRIENVLCVLENQLGDDLTPEQIAAIARGEGGTAKIFEPIAKRAMKQIEHQLDAAEAQVSDATVVEVLKRVRKIVSGELSLSAVVDEIVNVLNDEKVVAAGETIVQHGESVLDAIEGVSGNKVVSDALKVAEKAGITKSVVMNEIEKLDMNQILDTAGTAVTDDKARRKLVSDATDTALDFVLKVLPSMPVPPLDGVRDGLVYHISNLSMEGFKVKKEDINIELAGMRATKTRSASITGDPQMEIEEATKKVKATELLIIDIRRISAIFDNAIWSFEQTYMPYLKGKGTADVEMSNGQMRMQFELRKRKMNPDDKAGKDKSSPKNKNKSKWEPVLCLHDRSCSIGSVDLNLQGEGRLTWILNKLASIFKGPLRDYVVHTIVNVLTNRSGWLLERLNMVLAPYWDLILRTAKLSMDDLVEADEDVVVKETPLQDSAFIELVWREQLPLGMNLLMNDESGLLKVVDFPRGSAARMVCEQRHLDPDLFKGSTIVAVNGSEYDDQDDLFEALREPGRPKTVRFEFAETADRERIRRFVEGSNPSKGASDHDRKTSPDDRTFRPRTVELNEPGDIGIAFANSLDSFGIVVKGFVGGEGGTVLQAERSGQVHVGDLLTHVNDQLAIGSPTNGDGSTGNSRALHLLQAAAKQRPLYLTFVEPYLHHEIITRPPSRSIGGNDADASGPNELVLEERQQPDGSKRVAITGFESVSGAAESSGILLGDFLAFINGIPVGVGCRWVGEKTPSVTLNEVYGMVHDETRYPIGLTFARPRQNDNVNRWAAAGAASGKHNAASTGFSDGDADTFCVTAERPEQLGCVFKLTRSYDIIVSDFEAVPGTLQHALAAKHALTDEEEDGDGNGLHSIPPLSIDWLNGQLVPSYASTDMVRNALNRKWKSDGRLELWLCDDDLKQWVHSLLGP